MKAEDLMIGDWVQVPSELNRYKRIRNTFDMDEAVLYKPIPLTPEILEKNGFTKYLDLDNVHYWFTLINEHIRFSILYARNVFQWLGPLDFKYVHELQHALKLSKIEKEIEL